MPLTTAHHLRRVPTRSSASRALSYMSPRAEIMLSCQHHWLPAQMLFFRAAAGKAFTTFRAGLAFTITTLPKTSFSPPFVAGFVRSFSLHNPGRENKPVFETSVCATSANVSTNFEHTDFLSSHEVASASVIAPFVMHFVVWVFMGAIAPM